MNNREAVSIITDFLDHRRNQELRSCPYLLQELQTAVVYHLRSVDINQYKLWVFDDSFYLGEVRNGKRNGYGFYYWYSEDGSRSNGTLYMGGWRDGEKDGDDCFHFSSQGMCYYGSYKMGKQHCDHAHLIHRNGTEFEGEFVNGKLTRVITANSSFTYTSSDGAVTSYDKNTSRLGLGAGDRKGCLGIAILAVVLFFLFRMCS